MPREFRFKGFTVDELKVMPMDEFINLLPSRKRRSLRRGLTQQQRRLLEKMRALKGGDGGKPIKTHARDMVIFPEMVDTTLLVHNGEGFAEVMISEKMVGHYLGEFAITNKHVRHGRPGIGASRSSMYIPLK